MATSGTFSTRWESGTWAGRAKYYDWSGSWSKSGTTITLTNMQIYMGMVNSSHIGTGSGTDSITVSPGGSAQSVTFAWSGGNTSNTQALNNVSFTVGSSATSQILYCYIQDENTGSTTIYFDAAATPPTGLSASNVTSLVDGFSATVSVTGWGTGGSTAQRRRSMSVWTYDASSLVTPRCYNEATGSTMSSTITVSNAEKAGGDLTIIGNTRYTLSVYAENGGAGTGHQRVGDYVTLAPATTLTIGGQTLTSLTLGYSAPADGGYYNKTLQYSIDNGTTWTTYATVTGGTTQSGSFTISGLTAGDTYTILNRVTTTAGTTNGQSLTITLGSNMALYGSSNSQATKITGVYGGVSDEAKTVTKLYGSANSKSKLIHQGFGHIDYSSNAGY